MAKRNETERILKGIKASEEILKWFQRKRIEDKEKSVEVMIEKFIETVKEHLKGLRNLLEKESGMITGLPDR